MKISRDSSSLERATMDDDGEAKERSDARWSNPWKEMREVGDGADARAKERADGARSLEEARRDASEARARVSKTPEPAMRGDAEVDDARRLGFASRDAPARRTPRVRSASDTDGRRHGSEEVFNILSALGSINLAAETSDFDTSDTETGRVMSIREARAFEPKIYENPGSERREFATNNKENGQLAGSLGSSSTVLTKRCD